MNGLLFALIDWHSDGELIAHLTVEGHENNSEIEEWTNSIATAVHTGLQCFISQILILLKHLLALTTRIYLKKLARAYRIKEIHIEITDDPMNLRHYRSSFDGGLLG